MKEIERQTYFVMIRDYTHKQNINIKGARKKNAFFKIKKIEMYWNKKIRRNIFWRFRKV